MIGVTVFGLIFTPVFYVVFRVVSDRMPARAQAAQGRGDAHRAVPAEPLGPA